MTRSADRISGAERSRWLAELAETVDQAQRLARTLGIPEGNCSGANELYRRLESVRIEVEDLRRGGWATQRTEFNPKWMNLFPRNERQTY